MVGGREGLGFRAPASGLSMEVRRLPDRCRKAPKSVVKEKVQGGLNPKNEEGQRRDK